MTIQNLATCDLCGAVETYDNAVAPREWGSLRIVNEHELYKEYAICLMCMPPVEAAKRNRENGIDPDYEQGRADWESEQKAKALG